MRAQRQRDAVSGMRVGSRVMLRAPLERLLRSAEPA
jgi:hypothetical protein